MNTKILISNQDRLFYRDNGYWISPVLFEKEYLKTVVTHYLKVLNGTYETGIIPSRNLSPENLDQGVVKITNCLWADSTLSKIILSPIIGKISAELIGVNAVRYWRDHLWYKPGKSGKEGNVGWHQDYPYWQCAEPAELITAWVALNDITEDNGCVVVIPGSHKWGVFSESDLYSKDMEALEAKVKKFLTHKFETKPCILPAGSVLFHHCLTLHGSYENRTNNPRMSISTHLFPEGTRYKSGTTSDNFSNVKLFSGNDGEPFAGPFFPIVYRESDSFNLWDTNTST